MNQVGLVIPNYNGKHLLEKNLPKVLKAVNQTDVVIVDDGSEDGSADYIKNKFPQIKVIERITNCGFASAVNLGIKAVNSEIVLLLNTDVIPSPGFLQFVLPHFSDPRVFAVGLLDKSREGNQSVDRGRGVGEFSRGFLVHARGEINKTNTLWVNGGSSAFRKSIWENLGGMDEIYDPFYWEDIDLSYRALKTGYKIVFEARSQVTHMHEEGSIIKQYSFEKIKEISFRNQLIFVWKNITDVKYILSHLFWLPYHLIVAVKTTDWFILKAFVDAIYKIPEIFRKRRIQKFIIKDCEILASLSS